MGSPCCWSRALACFSNSLSLMSLASARAARFAASLASAYFKQLKKKIN